MNIGLFLRKEIEKTRQLISDYQYKLKCLEQLRKNNNLAEILKEYLIVEESRVDEDSYVDCIVLKEDCIHPLHSELEGVHVNIIKKTLEENNNEKL